MIIECGHPVPDARWNGPEGERTFCTLCQQVRLVLPDTTNEPVLPLPNDTVTTSDGVDEKVVASIWQNDDTEFGPIFALLLTLAPEAPYYRVREITWNGGRWDCNNVQEFPNIVPATAAYVENGGDY